MMVDPRLSPSATSITRLLAQISYLDGQSDPYSFRPCVMYCMKWFGETSNSIATPAHIHDSSMAS